MRIIAGTWRGRRLASPEGSATRPTSDRVREALASALEARGAFSGAHVLDLFAGTGALGLEALSRGATRLIAVEHDKRALRCLRDNVATLGAGDRCQVVALDLLGPPAGVAGRLAQTGAAPFALVVADPPYALADAAARLFAELGSRGLLGEHALLVLEHAARSAPRPPAGVEELARYSWGDTAAVLWRRAASAADGHA